MNIAAHMKNVKKKSNFVVNVSFDIPIEHDKFLIDQPLSGEFTITPNYPKKNIKLKVGSARTTQQPESRKLSLATDVVCISSSRNHRKNQNKSANKSPQIVKKHSKNLSYSFSKSPPKTRNKQERSKSSYYNQYTFKKFHNLIAQQIDEQITGYTNPSSQLKTELQKQQANTARTQKYSINKQLQSKRSPIMTPILNKYEKVQTQEMQLLNDMKKFEKNVKDKRQNISSDYMKQKILMQASARKIQRAWRNFRTRKLINAYSCTASLKMTNKMKSYLNRQQQFIYQPKKVLNVRSCGYNNGKSEMKKSIKQSKIYHTQQMNLQTTTNKNVYSQDLMKKMQYQKKIQIQQIQKWENLIKDLRKSKNIQQTLHKTEQHKNQILKKQLSNKHRQDKTEIANQQLKNTINKIEDQRSKQQIQKSLQLYQNKTNRNTNVQKTKYSFFSKDSSTSKKQEQNFVKDKKINYEQQQIVRFQKQNETISQLKEISNDQVKIQKKTQNNKQQLDNSSEQQTAQKNLLRNFQNLIKQYEEKDKLFLKVNTVKIQQHQNESAAYANQKREEQIKIISDQIFRKQFHQAIQQSEYLLKKNQQNNKNKTQKLPVQKQEKAEGICTNMQSIKDYLQNLISFIFDQCPERLIQGFNTPIGPSSKQLLETLRQTQVPFDENFRSYHKEEIMGKNLFVKHWLYASQQIYFQKKYSNADKEKQRIDRLKQITKVYFQAIFDCFNQCLSPYRVYGLKGLVYPWQSIIREAEQMSTIQVLKPKIKQAYKDLADLAAIFCGLHVEDKRPRLPIQMIEQIQEERMSLYLEHQLRADEHLWSETQFHETQIVLWLSTFVVQKQTNELTWQLLHLFKRTLE